MKPLFIDLDCISIKVDDLERAIAFYSEQLGHSLKWKTNTAAGLEFPNGNSELVVHTEQRPPGTDLRVESVPDAIKQFTEAGGKLFGLTEIDLQLVS